MIENLENIVRNNNSKKIKKQLERIVIAKK